MKYVYVMFDPLYERIVCVHEEENMVCDECKHIGDNSGYGISENKFKVEPSISMINVKFYYFNDEIDSDINFLIVNRIKMDYPDVVFTEQIEDEECSVVFEMEMDSVDEMDTFVCEEICHEIEVYCEITDVDGEGIKYFYDEDDEWV